MESYEVLGLFGMHSFSVLSFDVNQGIGWFFSDFFMEEFPAHVEYTGIYRYEARIILHCNSGYS